MIQYEKVVLHYYIKIFVNILNFISVSPGLQNAVYSYSLNKSKEIIFFVKPESKVPKSKVPKSRPKGLGLTQ